MVYRIILFYDSKTINITPESDFFHKNNQKKIKTSRLLRKKPIFSDSRRVLAVAEKYKKRNCGIVSRGGELSSGSRNSRFLKSSLRAAPEYRLRNYF